MLLYNKKISLVLFLLIVASSTTFPVGIYQTLEKQISTQTPCTCDCHKKNYTIKTCTICTHSGGKFMKEIHPSTLLENRENEDEERSDHD